MIKIYLRMILLKHLSVLKNKTMRMPFKQLDQDFCKSYFLVLLLGCRVNKDFIIIIIFLDVPFNLLSSDQDSSL